MNNDIAGKRSRKWPFLVPHLRTLSDNGTLWDSDVLSQSEFIAAFIINAWDLRQGDLSDSILHFGRFYPSYKDTVSRSLNRRGGSGMAGIKVIHRGYGQKYTHFIHI